MAGYKPDSYSDVSPYLIVDDAAATIKFLKAVFDARELRTHRNKDGGIIHAEARIGDSVVMMGEMPGAPQAHVHIYCADAPAAFERALAAGGQLVQPFEAKDDGDCRGGVRDENGVTWWIASQMATR